MAGRMGTATLLSVLLASVFACAARSVPPEPAPAETPIAAVPREPTLESSQPTPTPQASLESAPAETPVAVVPREPTLESSPPPPIPHASLEYEGRLYQGERGSYCWPVSQNSSVCADAAWWDGFDERSPVVVNRGSGFEIVISGDEPSPAQVGIDVFTVLETGQRARLGENVHSADVRTVPELDLPPGVYFLGIFLKFEVGDVSYSFKVQVVE